MSINDSEKLWIFVKILLEVNMGYQISYGQSGARKTRKSKLPTIMFDKTHLLASCCVLLCILLLAVCVIPQFRLFLRNMILPGDPDVTANALEQMVDAIGAGESVQTALTEFCRNILKGA